jgi:DNA mismatch repair protein MutS
MGVVDRIFTRVGASDNLSKGQSTFMVEMQEAANILNNATSRSLIILDEIGRGTSTYDGVSIAWAILEYLHEQIGAKTLFATHYHELIAVTERLERAKNYCVLVHEDAENGVVFLHKIQEGGIDKSYGIEVAKLAGLPQTVIEKAQHILKELEEGVVEKGIQAELRAHSTPFVSSERPHSSLNPEKPHPLEEKLKAIDVNQLTPIQALQALAELKMITAKNVS